MENSNIALTSLGYRKLAKGKWGKPIGYSILSIDETTSTISLVSVNRKGEPMYWSSEEINFDENLANKIKEFEANLGYGSGISYCQTFFDFSFLTDIEVWNSIL